MKLVVVFMLAAIPVCCYAGGSSGCSMMDNIIESTLDPSVSVDDYHATIEEAVSLPYNKDAVTKFKQCFLDQNEETLKNVHTMVEAIYESEDCPEEA
ncbi:mammaglobin-A [Peromyscus californicus insignis]|uniref:mammaglobin-A n=1 Tax=Peromyscus californicus insignis TaxID=564181 RepID=UPI0022A7F481|nr:mammaglobin-A [Peromyscus californicus insignis]